jgi:hypothetical protein
VRASDHERRGLTSTSSTSISRAVARQSPGFSSPGSLGFSPAGVRGRERALEIGHARVVGDQVAGDLGLDAPQALAAAADQIEQRGREQLRRQDRRAGGIEQAHAFDRLARGPRQIHSPDLEPALEALGERVADLPAGEVRGERGQHEQSDDEECRSAARDTAVPSA